ncbi:hypothetical protein ACJVC5_12925 [Peredibacter sp. HCB2-198]|uniref:hypothetical protein n=1 Tax=Peredibacter sp. HCB2-198 TaxID=3383025 RepID=UPI0038B4B330
MNRKAISHLLLLSSLISCTGGGGGSDSNQAEQLPTPNPLESEMMGTYQALLKPVNPTLAKDLNGSLTIVRERNEFIADVRFSAGPSSILHVQNIHVGKRCPTIEDDLNRDGYIDAVEGAEVYKEIIVPLDEDLNSQRMGWGTFPVADEYGYYFYSQVANFEKLMSDLKDEDINLQDDFAKLAPTETLQLTGNVVIITGVSKDIPLPETVAPRGRLTNFQAIPVACGVIQKLTSVPGRIDNDQTGIRYPGGETIGGSSGSDDGADFASSSTTTTTGGNYGEDDNEVEPTETGHI